ncbi:hypothetical protein BCR43DRAFT_507499 [Syncephalastrum racemosum]|uniref:G-protein coupled receptors family 3 profile domain-containing protein n=1 Tax=Syncephalastrum racemosum TaxID=13706 RepID=A0A1X2H3R1_SYNRA|nr:hypothetical protein BCR43DRAFT_507499 [Syncephalastrum racemosum]
MARSIENIIAKLLTLHRINQNIYIQYRCYISDKTLIRTTAFAFTAIALLLATWLSVTTVDFATIPVTSGDYFIQCDYSGSGSVALNIFVTLVSASMIAFGMVLSLRTRSLRVVARESMFSEAKQLHLTTYNIFFASLIGFIVFNTPTSDYFTRHFLTAALIVWGSTVSLLLLFLPKLHALFKRSSGIVSHNCSKATNNSQDNAEDQYQQQSTLMSINRMIATNNISGLQTDSPIGTSRSPDGTAVETSSSLQLGQRYQSAPVYRRVRLSRNRINADNTEGEDEADSMEVHEEKSHRGRVFPYTCATIANEEEGHVLKVHGSQCHDLLLQVENTEELHRWVAWFNER